MCGSLKQYELQMQLMGENMEGIMQIIAHVMDTSEEEKCFTGDRKEVERGEKICSVRGERRVVVAERDIYIYIYSLQWHREEIRLQWHREEIRLQWQGGERRVIVSEKIEIDRL